MVGEGASGLEIRARFPQRNRSTLWKAVRKISLGLPRYEANRRPTSMRKVSDEQVELARTTMEAAPSTSQRTLATRLGVCRATARRLLSNTLRLRNFKRGRVHKVSPVNKEKQLAFAQRTLLRLRAGGGPRRRFGKSPPALKLEDVVWSDEKHFKAWTTSYGPPTLQI